MMGGLQQAFFRWQFNRKQQQAFLEDLGSLVADGVPVNQSVEMIRDVSKEALHQVALDILTALAGGGLLADGMDGWFARPVVEVIRAGEESGTLQKALISATEAFGTQSNAIATVLNAVLYPLVVVCMALGLTVFMKSSVLESFEQIKPLAQWPSVGRHLYEIANVTQHFWWLAVALVIALIIGMSQLLKNLTGQCRYWLDRVPLLSLYRDASAARLMETLGLLLKNGVTLKKALAIMHRGAAPFLSWHLLLMEYRLSGGQENIADVLDTQLIRDHDLMRLRLVAKGKGFEHALVSLGKRAHARNGKLVGVVGRIVGGILLAGGAGLAITMVFGIYTVGSSIAM